MIKSLYLLTDCNAVLATLYYITIIFTLTIILSCIMYLSVLLYRNRQETKYNKRLYRVKKMYHM